MKIEGKSNEEIFEKLRQIHDNKYVYITSREQIKHKTELDIRCSIHGLFKQRFDHHSDGSGCPRCNNSFYKTTEEYIQEIRNIHGDKFKYDKVSYKNIKSRITLICPEHGEFTIRANRPLEETCACPRCINRYVFSTEDFIIKSSNQFGDRFLYNKVLYVNAKTKVIISCKEHGEFQMTPDTFFNSQFPCKRCKRVGTSLLEHQWLDSLRLPSLQRRVYVKINGKRFIFDGFDPITNTVYEFNGDYYHGNPKYFDSKDINLVSKKSFGSLYDLTIKREEFIKKAGYNLIVMWESDYCSQIGKQYDPERKRAKNKRVNWINFVREWQTSDDEYFDYLDHIKSG